PVAGVAGGDLAAPQAGAVPVASRVAAGECSVPSEPDGADSPGVSGGRPASSLALTLMAFTAPVVPASSIRPMMSSATPSGNSALLLRSAKPPRAMTYGGVHTMAPNRPVTAAPASLPARPDCAVPVGLAVRTPTMRAGTAT